MPGTTDRPSEQLVHAFSRFGPAWVRFLRSSVDLSPARMQLLKSLHSASQPTIQARLCDDLGVTPRNVTALVDGLEAEGLVRRTPHPSDRRATLVELTGAGIAALEQAWTEHVARAAELFDDLSAEDQQALARILGQLADGLHRREHPPKLAG